MKFRLAICTAGGPLLGSGHLHRMQTLGSLLQKAFCVSFFDATPFVRRLENGIFFLTKEGENFIKKISNENEGLLVDLRDIEPESLFWGIPVFFLDNRHPNRSGWEKHLARKLPKQLQTRKPTPQKNQGRENPSEETKKQVFFYDTLPHPALALDTILKQLWVPNSAQNLTEEGSFLSDTPLLFPEKNLLFSKAAANSKSALLYTGDLSVDDLAWLRNFFEELLWKKELGFLIHIGTTKLELTHPAYVHQIRMPASQFQALTKKSKYIFSYFGLSLFEAWQQKKIPVLYEIHTKEHDLLSRDLSKRAGLCYLTKEKLEATPKTQWSGLLPNGPPVCHPAKDGEERLAQTINRFFLDRP